MRVSELADKYGLKATELMQYLEECGIVGLKLSDELPSGKLGQVKDFLENKGLSPVSIESSVTLIKKRKGDETKASSKPEDSDKPVAKVRKKIIIKRKHVKPKKKTSEPVGAAGTSTAQAGKSERIIPAPPPVLPASNDRGPAKNNRKTQPQRGKGKKYYKNDRASQKEKEKEIIMRRKSRRQSSLDSVPDQIEIMEVVTIAELARKMNLKANEIISKLMKMGVMATINQQIDADTASLVAEEFNCDVKTVSLYDETVIEEADDKDEDLKNRPPIVTVMGHVDHGKTKLLDAIRSEDVVATESGGITQHIGAYQVNAGGGKVTFLDTPGHEAFTMMRARGAKVTDIVILVVAADDGIMPQTVEAIDHAKAAEVPIIVAINKMDRPEANIDRVKQQLAEHDLLAEDWGGQTMCVPISALQKTGIDDLLEAVMLQSEVMELQANPNKEGVGTVLEARVDPGKGAVTTVLCENGSVHVGDSFVAGVYNGRVRALFNDHGEKVDKAGPAMPVEVLGCSGLPQAGDPFHIVISEKRAKTISNKRQELKRVEDAKNVKKVTMENLFDRIQAGDMKELKVVIKADVQGSAEAVRDALEKIKNDQVRLVCIHHSAGAINESDVMLAAASDALVVGFHVRANVRAKETAAKEKVEVKTYSVIYDVIQDVQAAITGLMAPELKEKITGEAEVRDTFKVPKIGVIAGSYVTNGVVQRGNNIRVIRNGVEIHDGKVSSLKRFKDDAKEVSKGYECGIGIADYDDLQVGDVLESYYIQEIRPSFNNGKKG